MRLIDQFIAGSMFLIALYLVFSSDGNLNTVLRSAGAGITNVTGVLQGRGGGSGLPAGATTGTTYQTGGQVYVPSTQNSILAALTGLFGGGNYQATNPILY